jgi:hypothetical protein
VRCCTLFVIYLITGLFNNRKEKPKNLSSQKMDYTC